MILVDTSVWVGHLRDGDRELVALLGDGRVLMHPFVLGELSCGNLRQRADVLALLRNLPQAIPASDDEVLGFIERHALMGRGIGYMDAHLLAAASLSADARLWTRDQRLHTLAGEMGLARSEAGGLGVNETV